MAVKFSDLEDALLFVSGDPIIEWEAWVDRQTGKVILYCSEFDEEFDRPPEDVYTDTERYIPIPHKNDLDLGRSLALDFAKRHLDEEDIDRVYAYFRAPGAYRHFKDLLDRRNLLEKWYQFEEEAQRQALREWCEEEGIELDES